MSSWTALTRLLGIKTTCKTKYVKTIKNICSDYFFFCVILILYHITKMLTNMQNSSTKTQFHESFVVILCICFNMHFLHSFLKLKIFIIYCWMFLFTVEYSYLLLNVPNLLLNVPNSLINVPNLLLNAPNLLLN